MMILPSLLFADNQNDTYLDISKHQDIYNAILRELEINYVDSLDHKKMLKTSVDAMLATLDPYTQYFPESEQNDIKQLSSGEYAGIGAVITQVKNKIYILEPFVNTPAYKNDILAGDQILEIDGVKLDGKNVSEASNMLRGTPGTEITLVLKRRGEKRELKKKFYREVIQTPTIAYSGVVRDSIGIIVVSDFIDRTFTDFQDALHDLVFKKHVKSLVVDLRNNGGGLVSQAVSIAGLFVPKGTTILTMKMKEGSGSKVYKTENEPLYPHMPLAFIVNENTASASEILSGSLQDLDRAVILGKRSFGKGLVQSIRMLPFNGYLKVTTAKYYIPSGRCIQEIDYANRQPDGKARVVPDSLTKEFKTVNGRTVRDGSGITPDIELQEKDNFNISYYLFTKNIFFLYVNKFVISHPTIAPPDSFKLTDAEYNDFCQYVVNSKFTYQQQSDKYLKRLEEVVDMEGYTDSTAELFKQLKEKLKLNVPDNLRRSRSDVEYWLTQEIIKRYYYRRGMIQYDLIHDDWLTKAAEVVSDKSEYRKILHLQ